VKIGAPSRQNTSRKATTRSPKNLRVVASRVASRERCSHSQVERGREPRGSFKQMISMCGVQHAGRSRGRCGFGSKWPFARGH
jgi:hypothetical protein